MALLLAVLISSCTSDTASLFENERMGPGQGSGSDESLLVGDWQVELFIAVEGDVQIWETTWSFREDLTCVYTQRVRSVLDDIITVEIRPCTWSTSSSVLRIVFTDTGGQLDLPYRFVLGRRDRLILEGFEYVKLGP